MISPKKTFAQTMYHRKAGTIIISSKTKMYFIIRRCIQKSEAYYTKAQIITSHPCKEIIYKCLN